MITFANLVEQFYAVTAAWGLPWLVPTLVVMTIVVGVVVGYIAVAAMFLIWWERKISAHIQVRFGPMRVGGWHGWAQSIADGIKLLLKEDIIPVRADKVVFVLAPMVVFAAALAGYVTIPWAPGLIVRDLNIGILYMISISSLTVVGIIMAGWSSNNKYATLGAMRSAAQAVSYEVPLVLSLLGPVMLAGTMSMHDLERDYDALRARHGIRVIHDAVTDIDVVTASTTLTVDGGFGGNDVSRIRLNVFTFAIPALSLIRPIVPNLPSPILP